jgi:hypothetical protein
LAKFGIGARLGIGFGICVLFTLIVSVVGIHGNNTQSRFTEDLHTHPFAVTNALRAANGDIIEIRGAVKDLLSLADPKPSPSFLAVIRDRERDAEARLALVRERYLGDPADAEQAIRDFEKLRVVRDRIIALTLEGKLEAARTLSNDMAAPLYAALRADMGS